MKKKSTYKVTDLFGNENLKIIRHSPPKHNLFDDYDTWLEKFQHKKTTDDVYTPHSIYTVVLDYLAENYDLQGKEILRPFYPGGDYERFNYPKNGIVVDNPPFSILSSICRFYIKNDIPFLLFAPHLTLFSSDIDATHIVVGANIRYENGAIIKTSFLSNMFGTAKIIGEPMLYIKIKQVQEEKKIEKLKYQYPNNVLTVSRVQQLIERGYSIRIDKHQVRYCRRLDGQKAHKKAILGSGFFIPDNISTKIAEQIKQINNQPTDIIYWQLSQREQAMIKALNQLTTNNDTQPTEPLPL